MQDTIEGHLEQLLLPQVLKCQGLEAPHDQLGLGLVRTTGLHEQVAIGQECMGIFRNGVKSVKDV